MVPGGGPSLDGTRWITSKHPTHKNRRKPFLMDNVELGQAFRAHFVAGLRRLIRSGKLRIEGEFTHLKDASRREAWLDELQATDWNVFIGGPPHGRSNPIQVVKYLARYMSGGPIADRRLISHEQDEVTFWARSKDKQNQSEPFTLRGVEFVRRWSMHILPKGYTRSRSYGGYHSSKRVDYLELCRQLLPAAPCNADQDETAALETPAPTPVRCPACNAEMACISSHARPSWRETFTASVYQTSDYCPLLHIPLRRHASQSIGGYG